MSKAAPPKSRFSTEQKVQDWLEDVIARGKLTDTIKGAGEVKTALQKSTSSEFWPQFPIDYLDTSGK